MGIMRSTRWRCLYDRLAAEALKAAQSGAIVRSYASMLALAPLVFLTSASLAGDSPVRLNPGEAVDLYFEVNLSGQVHVKLGAAPPGQACADFWWIKWPLGNIERLGRHCQWASFDIPGLNAFTVSAKLRAGNPPNAIQLFASDRAEVANSYSFSY